jgi:hypothetical protein
MKLRYIGNGDYIHGVPARDLSAAEAKDHGDAIAASEKATGKKLYESVAQNQTAETVDVKDGK